MFTRARRGLGRNIIGVLIALYFLVRYVALWVLLTLALPVGAALALLGLLGWLLLRGDPDRRFRWAVGIIEMVDSLIKRLDGVASKAHQHLERAFDTAEHTGDRNT